MRTTEGVVMTAWMVVVLGVATLALLAVSDAVHCANPGACQNATTGAHYKAGVPAPRLRSFANAPWTGASSLQSLKSRGSLQHE